MAVLSGLYYFAHKRTDASNLTCTGLYNNLMAIVNICAIMAFQPERYIIEPIEPYVSKLKAITYDE